MTKVLQILPVDERIRIQVSQVVIGLINKKIQCHYCKKFGHYAYECRKKQYDQRRQSPSQLTSTSTSTSAMLMASTYPLECNVVQESTHGIWYLDSGCSNHMTGNLNLFLSLDNSVQTDVTLGNNVQVIVLGKGTVGILTKQGESKCIPDVYLAKV